MGGGGVSKEINLEVVNKHYLLVSIDKRRECQHVKTLKKWDEWISELMSYTDWDANLQRKENSIKVSYQ